MDIDNLVAEAFNLSNLITDLLKRTDISIKKIEQELSGKGFETEMVSGDESHATYVAFLKHTNISIGFVKCTCSYIHLLDDMCIKCHPDWAVSLYKDGTYKVNPEFLQSLSNSDDLPF